MKKSIKTPEFTQVKDVTKKMNVCQKKKKARKIRKKVCACSPIVVCWCLGGKPTPKETHIMNKTIPECTKDIFMAVVSYNFIINTKRTIFL